MYIKPIASGTTGAASGGLVYNLSTGLVTYATFASIKTFVIDHPSDPARYLVHGCLEGPEAGVYYRGRGEIVVSNVEITLPDYVHKIATDFTIQLTPIITPEHTAPRVLGSTDTDGKTFKVYGPPGPFYWSVTGRRLSVEAEPLRSSATLKGDGPYTYLA
jgi:hypothetical protein